MNKTLFRKHYAACVLGCLLATMAMGTGAPADDVSTANDVAMVQPFVSETTFLVFKLDPTRLAVPGLVTTLNLLEPESKEGRLAWIQEMEQGLKTFQTVTGGQPVHATVRIPRSHQERPVLIFLDEKPKMDRQQFLDFFGTLSPMDSFVRDGRIVVMPKLGNDTQATVDALVPQPRERLGEAFEAVSDYPIQVLLMPPDHVRRTVVELMPELPAFLGGGSSRLLTDGLVWAAVGMDLEKFQVELVVQSASPEAARDLAENLPDMLRAAWLEGLRVAVTKPQARMLHDMVDTLLPSIDPQVDGDRCTVRLNGLELVGTQLIEITVSSLYDRYRQETDMDHFKHILLGMHNYHDTYKMFPPRDEARDKDGNSGLSWRVHILPFTEKWNLYKQFHLDEPWDSPHNKTLIEKMPEIYRSRKPGIKPDHTTFLAPVGEDTVFGGKKAAGFQDLTDGSSNTIALVEVKPELAVPWTAPKDYKFDPKDPGRGLEIRANGQFLSAFVDGSARKLPGDLDPEMLLRLFQKSDGQPIGEL